MRYRVLHASLLTGFLFVTVIAVWSQKPHYFSTKESQYRRAEERKSFLTILLQKIKRTRTS